MLQRRSVLAVVLFHSATSTDSPLAHVDCPLLFVDACRYRDRMIEMIDDRDRMRPIKVTDGVR